MHIRNMTNEEKLDAIYEMTKENHEILRSIHKQNYVSIVFRIIYWLVVLGFIGGAYFYVRPLIGMVTGNATKVEDMVNQINQMRNQIPDAKIFNQVLQGLQKPTAPVQ